MNLGLDKYVERVYLRIRAIDGPFWYDNLSLGFRNRDI
jgi:hypothetical protein